MKVEISDLAEADVEAVGIFIARDNPARAARFVQELLGACHGLGEWPEASPLVPGSEAFGYRRRIYKSYMIVYRVGTDRIKVSRVFHSARDFERVMFPKD